MVSLRTPFFVFPLDCFDLIENNKQFPCVMIVLVTFSTSPADIYFGRYGPLVGLAVSHIKNFVDCHNVLQTLPTVACHAVNLNMESSVAMSMW